MTPPVGPTIPAPPTPQAKKGPSQRHFDLLKEHRSYCPYVVRSTIVPTLPSAAPVNGHTRSHSIPQLHGQNGTNALEGWRAVLTVVLRYGLGQRQRLGLDFTPGDDTQDSMEADGVKAMVEDVKSRGVGLIFPYHWITLNFYD